MPAGDSSIAVGGGGAAQLSPESWVDTDISTATDAAEFLTLASVTTSDGAMEPSDPDRMACGNLALCSR
jgi:hypothetical protein